MRCIQRYACPVKQTTGTACCADEMYDCAGIVRRYFAKRGRLFSDGVVPVTLVGGVESASARLVLFNCMANHVKTNSDRQIHHCTCRLELFGKFKIHLRVLW